MAVAKKKFAKTPTGQYKRWTAEFETAKPIFKKYHKKSEKVVKQFLAESNRDDEPDANDPLFFKLNLFHANVTTLMAMLYGNTPKVEVDRSFADAQDDISRVASVISTRMLNQDIQKQGSTVVTVLRQCLEDRLLPGMGNARCKYDFKTEVVETPTSTDPATGQTIPAVSEEKVTDEWVDIVYTHWKDYMHSPARTYDEIRWKSYRSFMARAELVKRFGEELGNKIPCNTHGPFNAGKEDNSPDKEQTVEAQAEVWEIWSKLDKKVYWLVEGFQQILAEEADPLELDGFWPDPPPMIANATTSRYMPKSDYSIAQDLYLQINELETRIAMLTKAAKLIGVYDKTAKGIERIFTEGVENDLIPVDNWAAFAEKGGLQGSITWLPLEDVVNSINTLAERQATKIQQLYEVTGMSDILRGASQKYEAAATSKVKAQFASIRVQALQDEFARFASDLQAIKMEIMQKHFEPYCFVQQSNIMDTPDRDLAEQAIALLKDIKKSRWKVKIRPETLAQADYAQLRDDRVEYLTGISTFMQSAAPLAQMDKGIVPFLLQLLQWGLAGFKGSNEIEGVMDRAIKMFEDKAKQPEQEKPDPQAEKIKAEMQLAQQEHQQKMEQNNQEFQLKTQELQQEMQMQREKMQQEIQQDQQKFALEMKQMMLEFQMQMKELGAKLDFQQKEQQLKTEEQAAQFTFNSAEREHAQAMDEKSSEGQLDHQKQMQTIKQEQAAKPKADADA
jgi:hypothetical protein